jgi:hypothetical protein
MAQSAPPHIATFTWAPSCANQSPLGSADAVRALKSAINVTTVAVQSPDRYMGPHFAKLQCTSKPKS